MLGWQSEGWFKAGGVAPASFSAIAGLCDGQDLGYSSSTYTSPTVTFTNGIALVFLTSGGRVNTITSVTIKGVPATQIASTGDGVNMAAYYAPVTAGSGNFVMTNSLAVGGVVICGGMITSSTPTPSAGSYFANPAHNTPDDTVTSPITIPTNGIGIAVGLTGGVADSGGGSFPMIWTGATRIAAMEFSNVGNTCGAYSTTPGSFAPTFFSQAPSGGNPYWAYQQPVGMAVVWAP